MQSLGGAYQNAADPSSSNLGSQQPWAQAAGSEMAPESFPHAIGISAVLAEVRTWVRRGVMATASMFFHGWAPLAVPTG